MMDKENKITLYGASAELAKLDLLIDEEVLPENYEELYSHLTEFLQNKTDLCAGYDQQIDDYADAIDKRIKELKELKDKVLAKQKRFHKYILDCLDALKVTSIEGNLYSVSYRKPIKVVEIIDENELPIEFLKIIQTTTIDRISLLKRLKEGEYISGATLKDSNRSISFKGRKV